MKPILYLLIIAVSACSCNRTDKALQDRISSSDSIAINYFKGDGKMDTVTAVKVVRDKAIIQQLAAFIAASQTSPEKDCGMDGSVHFFKGDAVIQDVYFRNSASCKQFSYAYGGEQKASALNEAAFSLLEKIRH